MDTTFSHIKAVFCDIDGTLLTSQHTVSPRTVAAIRALRECGVLFGLCTGRDAHATEAMYELWGIEGLVDVMVGCGGAEVIDRAHGINELSYPLPGETIARICVAAVRTFAEKRCLVSSPCADCRSSAFVRMTESGVLSSCDASATNCFCCCHASSTGRTAHLASSTLSAKNTARLPRPMRTLVRMRLLSVACSALVSAKTYFSPSGVTALKKRRW